MVHFCGGGVGCDEGGGRVPLGRASRHHPPCRGVTGVPWRPRIHTMSVARGAKGGAERRTRGPLVATAPSTGVCRHPATSRMPAGVSRQRRTPSSSPPLPRPPTSPVRALLPVCSASTDHTPPTPHGWFAGRYDHHCCRPVTPRLVAHRGPSRTSRSCLSPPPPHFHRACFAPLVLLPLPPVTFLACLPPRELTP